MKCILIFAEGNFERLETRPTLAEARAYSDGITDGADLYGAGGCGAFVMPDDEAEMREWEKSAQIERAMIALADKLERQRLTESP